MPHNGTRRLVNMKNVLPHFYPESSPHSVPPVIYGVAGVPRGKAFVGKTAEQPPWGERPWDNERSSCRDRLEKESLQRQR